jgi:hypothetical protein
VRIVPGNFLFARYPDTIAKVSERTTSPASLYEILQILSLTMFEKIPLDQLLAQTMSDEIQQLILFA